MGTIFGGKGMRPLTLIAIVVGLLMPPLSASAVGFEKGEDCRELKRQAQHSAKGVLRIQSVFDRFVESYADAVIANDDSRVAKTDKQLEKIREGLDQMLAKASHWSDIYHALCKD